MRWPFKRKDKTPPSGTQKAEYKVPSRLECEQILITARDLRRFFIGRGHWDEVMRLDATIVRIKQAEGFHNKMEAIGGDASNVEAFTRWQEGTLP